VAALQHRRGPNSDSCAPSPPFSTDLARGRHPPFAGLAIGMRAGSDGEEKRRRLDDESGGGNACSDSDGEREEKRRRLDDESGGGNACSDSALVSDFLLRQVRLRVRVVEDDVDEAAEDAEWARRFQTWAQEEEGEERECGVDQILQELGLGQKPETRVIRAPAAAPGEAAYTWYKCSDSPRVSTRKWHAAHVQSTDTSEHSRALTCTLR